MLILAKILLYIANTIIGIEVLRNPESNPLARVIGGFMLLMGIVLTIEVIYK